VDILVELLKVIVWPAVVIFVCLRFGEPLRALLSAAAEGRLSLKAGPAGVELTQAVQAAAAVGVASGAQAAREGQSADQAAIAAQIARAVRTTVATAPATQTRRVLWVDDNPQNNALLARSFRDLGIEVREASSTEAAMAELTKSRFGLVITDMGRPPDGEAGLTLIERMRQARISVPVIIYAAAWAEAHRGEEGMRGVSLITSRPNEVYTRALEMLLGAS
jgi:CheY-like chemotaxis protein